MLSKNRFNRNYHSAIGMLILILFATCKPQPPPAEDILHVVPEFITRLHPVDNQGVSNDVSLNVIQGITGFENGWFVTQKSGTSILLLNYLDRNGQSLFHTRLAVNSHGQDLSLEQVSDNELHLFTTYGSFNGNRNTGLLELQVQLAPKINNERDWSATTVSVANQYPLNYTNATPCIDNSKEKFAVRSLNTILIHEKSKLKAGNLTADRHFTLNNSQLVDNENFTMWFQGIEMHNDKVFCMTGNGRLTSHKKIYVYNHNGEVLDKYVFDKNDFSLDIFDKFEPEGLYLKDKQLNFTIMTKSETEQGNIKFLYKITLQ